MVVPCSMPTKRNAKCWKQLYRPLNLLSHPAEESFTLSWNAAPSQVAPDVTLDKDGNRIGQSTT
jgi:hypothetical protein